MSGKEDAIVVMDQNMASVQPLILKAMEKGTVNVFNIQVQNVEDSGNVQDNSTNFNLIKEGDKVPSLPSPCNDVMRNTLDVIDVGKLLEAVGGLLDVIPEPKLPNLLKLVYQESLNRHENSSQAAVFLGTSRGTMKNQIDRYRLTKGGGK